MRPPYLYNGNSYTAKAVISWYWDGPQGTGSHSIEIFLYDLYVSVESQGRMVVAENPVSSLVPKP